MGATNGFKEEKELVESKKRLLKMDGAKWHGYLAHILSTYEGRSFAYVWFDQNLCDENAMTGNSFTYYLLGMQEMARTMQKHMKAASFDGWVEMEREARQRKQED